MGVKKGLGYMAIILVFNSHSLRLRLGELQGVAGGGGELCLEGETDAGSSECVPQVYVPLLYVLLGYVCVLCVYFLLGAWSMALVLWRPFEYYYPRLACCHGLGCYIQAFSFTGYDST